MSDVMDGYFGVTDSARLLGVTRTRVWQWIKRKALPAVRVGQQWFVLVEDLRALSDRRTRAAEERRLKKLRRAARAS